MAIEVYVEKLGEGYASVHVDPPVTVGDCVKKAIQNITYDPRTDHLQLNGNDQVGGKPVSLQTSVKDKDTISIIPHLSGGSELFMYPSQS